MITIRLEGKTLLNLPGNPAVSFVPDIEGETAITRICIDGTERFIVRFTFEIIEVMYQPDRPRRLEWLKKFFRRENGSVSWNQKINNNGNLDHLQTRAKINKRPGGNLLGSRVTYLKQLTLKPGGALFWTWRENPFQRLKRPINSPQKLIVPNS